MFAREEISAEAKGARPRLRWEREEEGGMRSRVGGRKGKGSCFLSSQRVRDVKFWRRRRRHQLSAVTFHGFNSKTLSVLRYDRRKKHHC